MDDLVDDEEKNTENWKQILENNFQQWLYDLEEIPATVETSSLDNLPDLYSFYQEICVLRNEFRRGGRRQQEIFSQFGDSLSQFQKEMAEIQKQFSRQKEEQETSQKLSSLLPMLDLFVRFERLRSKLKEKPKTTIFFNNAPLWEKQWNIFGEGFQIAFSHFEQFLKKEGFVKIETVGKLFDATLMIAIAVDKNANQPNNTVIEEIAPGFFYQNNMIKLAEVKISKKE